jgi:tetratricopeptide (TPR) repeat protein
LLAVGVGVSIPLYQHANSPGYRAGRQLAEADRLVEEGQPGKAAGIYRQLAQGSSEHAGKALDRIKGLLEGTVRAAPAADAVAIFEAAIALGQGRGMPADLFERGRHWAQTHGAANPRCAVAVLDAVGPFAPKPADVQGALRPLLERLVRDNPQDVELATRLAVAYDAAGRRADCEKLLTPHRDKLGDGEGARILGQVLAARGQLDAALPLLRAYTDKRLAEYRVAIKEFQTAAHEFQQQVFAEIDRGGAADFPYDRYANAGQDERQAIEREYITARMKADPALVEKWAAVSRFNGAVEAALQLGTLRLQRAQGMDNAAARRAELKAAEETFLGVSDIAGRWQEYRLNLGQVYYWLGKHAEGKAQFEEALKDRNRDTEMLLQVSTTLRSVGAVSEARALAEEAYNKEQNPARKFEAATTRALIPVDTRDQITWLERANPADAQIQAWLGTARGNQALQDGQDEEAAKHLRKAIEIYGKMEVNAATLNNCANAWSSLYRATGDRAALTRAAEMMERAIALQPGNSILLGNAARTTLETALQEIIGDAIDLGALRATAGLDLLSYLYRDQAGRDRLAERVRRSPRVARALSHFDRLMLLAPKGPHGYGMAESVYAFTRDAASLKRLLRRVEDAKPDAGDDNRQALDYYQGKEDARMRKEAEAALPRLDAVVKARRAKKDVTFAVAVATLVRQKTVLDSVGGQVDCDELVKLAEEAHAAVPSVSTRSTLLGALLMRAERALRRDEPAFAAMAKGPVRRALGPTYLIAAALWREGKARDAAARNADVRRAQQLLAADVARFPNDADEWTWVMLRQSHPDQAAKSAAVLRRDQVARARLALDLKLSPTSAPTALRAYWARHLAGDEKDGAAILKTFAARGVPLPWQ